jgi:site-specific DNA recombinase
MRAIGYARVSTDDQARDGVSIDNQIERITAYCVAKEWDLGNVYIDEGLSAKTLNRTGLQQVVTTLKGRDIDAVIVYKLDRLTRSVVDLNKLIELFDRYNVALVSLVESLDATSATGRLMLNLLASVSQWEREVIVERTRDAIAYLKANNRIYTREIFGYDVEKENSQLVPNYKEQQIIERMYNLRSDGLSYQAIADTLNADGIPAKRGGKWYNNTVRRTIVRG